jgi:hypothetical protein
MGTTIPLTMSASTGRRLLAASAAALTVIAMSATASASPKIPATNPAVSSLHLTPATVAHGGGAVVLKATVHHASTCKVTSSRHVSGLPVTHSCSSGHLSVTFHVGADPTAALRHIIITLRAAAGSHHTTKTVTLTQAAAPLPTVTGFVVSPAHLASGGGHVHLTATVHHATTCKLSVAPALAGLPVNVACTSAAFSRVVSLPADASSTAHSYLFTLSAHGSGGTKTASTHPMATVAGSTGSSPIASLTARGAPLPSGANSGDNEDATLDSVSCPSAGHCVAVGQYEGPVGGSVEVNQPGLIETLNGTTWTASTAPPPSDASTTEPAIYLNSVSCSSATACVAVGRYLDTDSGFAPYVASLSGTTWTWEPASVPTDPQNQSLRIGGDLNSVSCVSGGCIAVGDSQPPGDDADALIEEPGASSWTGIQAPLPANAEPEEDSQTEVFDEFYSVSCTTGTSCTAVGEYTIDTVDGIMTVGLGDTLSGSDWTASQLPPTADEGYDTAVSCVASDCTGTGDYLTSTSHIQTEVSGAWDDDITAPQPTTPANGAQLKAVDCATSTSCVLVGGAYTSGASPTLYGLIDTGSGTTYSDLQANLPSNAVAGTVQLLGVSCPVAGSCGAIGSYRGSDDLGAYDNDLVEIETTSSNVSTWTPSEVPLPSAGSSALGLASTSCVASWGCVSVGNYSPDGAGVTVDGELVAGPL